MGNDQRADTPLTPDESAMIENWAEVSAWAEHCDHCQVTATARDVGNGRTIVEIKHEPACPHVIE